MTRWVSLLKFRHFIIGAVLTALSLSYLFHKSSSVDVNHHSDMINSFSMMSQLSIAIEKFMIETRHGYFMNYDPLVEAVREQKSFHQRLQQKLPLDNVDVKNAWDNYLKLTRSKLNMIETFKSHHAVLRNSQHYFPILISQLSGLLNNEGLDANEDIGSLRRDYQLLNQKVTSFLMTPGDQGINDIQKILRQLRQYTGVASKEIKPVLDDITRHVDIIISNKQDIDRSLQNVLQMQNESAIYHVRESYFRVYSQQQARANLYRLALIIISGLFAIIIFLIVMRLSKAREKLEKTVNDLNFMKFALDQHAIVSTTNIKGDITYVNKRFCQITGYRKEELLGNNHRILKSPVHDEAFFKDLWQTIAKGEVWQGELQNISKSGEAFWVFASIVPTLNEKGKPFQYISIRTDITSRKLMEEALRKEQAFLSGLTNAIGQGVYVLDAEGLCTFMNAEAQNLLGWDFEELKGKIIHDYIHYETCDGEGVTKDECPISQAVKEGEVFRSDDEVFFHRDGTAFPVSAVSVPMTSDTGEISGSVTAFSDITENKRKEAELLEARNTALQASKAKSDFLSSMSHELRTPMNAILGFSQLLEIDESLNEEQQDFVSEINKAGQHLLELINEVLDLARIEAGRVELVLEDINFTDLAYEALSLIEPLASKNHIAIELESKDDEEILVNADRTRLKQVVINLLSNAVKYNRPEGSVTLSCEQTLEQMLRIKIADTGYGIPVDKQKELFQPFSRVTENESEIEGTGIGLVISRTMAEMMGGTLGFESIEGEGSVFWIDIPLSGREAIISNDNNRVEAKEAPKVVAVSQKKVLYVEDNPANLRLVTNIFTKLDGIELVSAMTPSEGMELAASEKPDLILLDINMPEMSGYEMYDALREIPAFSKVPIMAISANAMPADVEKGLSHGFDEYLTKPLDIKNFIDKVHQYLS